MKVLIVGLGSIARKHIEVLRIAAPGTEFLALRSGRQGMSLEGVTDIYSWQEVPDDISFVIISNPTASHRDAIMRSLALRKPLFIEKPPLADTDGAGDIIREVKKRGILTYTAFVLRFHPVIAWMKKNVDNATVNEVNVYCGSWLPDWRPGTDYRKSYSAKNSAGGGVHLDLIHEIDYIRWIFGDPVTGSIFLSHHSSLETDSPDSAHYYLGYDSFSVSVTLNYFRRDPKRTIEVVTEEKTLTGDLLAGTVVSSPGNDLLLPASENHMYLDQMRYFLGCIERGVQPDNSFEYSLQTLKTAIGK